MVNFLSGRPPVWWARCILGAIFFVLVGWLILCADKPWQFDLGTRDNWRIREYAGFFSFWAAVLNLVILTGLFATAGWWAAQLPLPCVSENRPKTSRWFWPCVIGAMIFCGAASAMRMNFGFAHDEDYSARRVISGAYKLDKDGEVRGEKLRWRDTFFYYRKPNNHPLHSVAARLCVEASRLVGSTDSWHMREWIVRTPAWIGGLGAVGMLAIFLRRLVSPRAGIIAAWLLAIHPWHIRYASEARGYSLLLALIPVVLYCWMRVMGENRWKWWLLLALAQLALVYCYPAAIYILVVLNSLTFLWLLTQAARSKEWTTIGRWFASNSFAGMAVLQLTLPLVPQLQKYMKTEEARQPLTFEWQYNTAAHFLSGTSWSKTKLLESPHPELMPYAMANPVFFGLVLAALLAFGLWGCITLFRGPAPVHPIAAATLLVPGLLGFLIAKAFNQWMFEWYLIYLLPGLVAGVAVGVDHFGNRLSTRLSTGWPAVTVAAAVVLAYGFFSQPFRAWYCTRPVEPVKEAALAVRKTLDPNDPRHKEILTATLLGKAWYYDPHAEHLKSPEQFIALLQRADRENKPLHLTVPNPWAAAYHEPALWRLFYEAGLFTDYQTFCGFDETHVRINARYVPGAVEGFRLKEFLRGRESFPNPKLPPLIHPAKPEIFPADGSST
jgi:hypothetical protein